MLDWGMLEKQQMACYGWNITLGELWMNQQRNQFNGMSETQYFVKSESSC